MTKTAKKTFQAVPAPQTPGDDRMRLTAKWEGLPAGTYIRPLSAGHGYYGGELIHTRTISVVAGPHAGARITGPY